MLTTRAGCVEAHQVWGVWGQQCILFVSRTEPQTKPYEKMRWDAFIFELALGVSAVCLVCTFADENQRFSGIVAAFILVAVAHNLLLDGSATKNSDTGALSTGATGSETISTGPEHQILLAGCSGAGKTVLSRQLSVAFGSSTEMSEVELLKAASDVRCSVLASMAAMVRHVHDFLPQSQHDMAPEDLRAFQMWVVEIQLHQPLSKPIADCAFSRDDNRRVRAADELAQTLAQAFGVSVHDIHCPTLEEKPAQLATSVGGDMQLSFALCVAGGEQTGRSIEATLWANMLDTEEALGATIGAKEVTVYEDAEDIVRYLCPIDTTDVAYAEKWACVFVENLLTGPPYYNYCIDVPGPLFICSCGCMSAI